MKNESGENNPWIDVNTKLPEDGQAVYVLASNRSVISIAKYKNGEWTIYKGEDPSHWTPIVTTIDFRKKSK